MPSDDKFNLYYDQRHNEVSYGRRFETDEGVVGVLAVYYLDEEDAEDARENPYRHYDWQSNHYSLEQALNYGLKRKDIVITEREIISYYRPFDAEQHPDLPVVEWMVFSWEDKFVVFIHFYKNEQGFGTEDFVKDLTFEMLPLNKGE